MYIPHNWGVSVDGTVHAKHQTSLVVFLTVQNCSRWGHDVLSGLGFRHPTTGSQFTGRRHTDRLTLADFPGLFSTNVFLLLLLLCFVLETGSFVAQAGPRVHSVASDGLEFLILLLPFLKLWGFMCVLLCPTVLGIQSRCIGYVSYFCDKIL